MLCYCFEVSSMDLICVSSPCHWKKFLPQPSDEISAKLQRSSISGGFF